MSEAMEPRLLTFGEAMVIFTVPHVGLFGSSHAATYGIGGAESNVAIGAARLGCAVTWIGRIGNDASGAFIERTLRAEGIDTKAVRDDSFTGVMVKHQRIAGRSVVDYHRRGSAGSRLSAPDLELDRIGEVAMIHLTGITPALSPTARAASFAAAEAARTAGVRVSLDLNYRSKLWGPREAGPILRALVAKSDLVFAGPDEARLVLGASADDPDADVARLLQALGPQEVIIKDGDRGARSRCADEAFTQAPTSVNVIDPVGAGDAFVAAYLARSLTGAPPADRLALASRAGAFAVATQGDCEGLATEAELDRFLGDADDVSR